MKFSQEKGFTIVEAMISGSIVLGVIILMSKGFKDQMGGFQGKEKMLFAKQLSYEMVNNAKSSPKDLPPFRYQNIPLVNIRCFDFKGVPLTADINTTLSDDKLEKPSGECDALVDSNGKSHRTYVEIHQWWFDSSTIHIFALVYDKEGNVADQIKMTTEVPPVY